MDEEWLKNSRRVLDACIGYYSRNRALSALAWRFLFVVVATYYAISIPCRWWLSDFTHTSFIVVDVLASCIVFGHVFPVKKEDLGWWVLVIGAIPTELFIPIAENNVASRVCSLTRLCLILVSHYVMASVMNIAYRVHPVDFGNSVGIFSIGVPCVLRALSVVCYVHWWTCLWMVIQNTTSYVSALEDVICVSSFSCGQQLQLKTKYSHVAVMGMYLTSVIFVGYLAVVLRTALSPVVVWATRKSVTYEWTKMFQVLEIPNGFREDMVGAYFEGTNQLEVMEGSSQVIESVKKFYQTLRQLERIELFRTLTADCLHMIASKVHEVVLSPGQVIVRHGESGDAMFVLVKGSVIVVSPHTNVLMARISTPTILGEVALVSKIPRTATVVAVSPCLTYKLSKENYELISHLHPAFQDILRELIRVRFHLAELQFSAQQSNNPDPSECASITLDAFIQMERAFHTSRSVRAQRVVSIRLDGWSEIGAEDDKTEATLTTKNSSGTQGSGERHDSMSQDATAQGGNVHTVSNPSTATPPPLPMMRVQSLAELDWKQSMIVQTKQNKIAKMFGEGNALLSVAMATLKEKKKGRHVT